MINNAFYHQDLEIASEGEESAEEEKSDREGKICDVDGLFFNYISGLAITRDWTQIVFHQAHNSMKIHYFVGVHVLYRWQTHIPVHNMSNS